MKMKTLYSLSFGFSLFLAPDFLTVYGNGLGNNGVFFLILLAAVFGVFLFTVKTSIPFTGTSREFNNEYTFNSSLLGKTAGFIFPFISKAVMAVCIGVGLLATAGYAFNELFIRWFPNMAFSLTTLGLLLVIGISGSTVIRCFQLLFSGTAIAAMIILIIMGLTSSALSGNVSNNIDVFHAGNISSFLSCFILLMGFELANNNAEYSGKDFSLKNSTIIILITGFIVLFLWGIVSILLVAPNRLSDTFIPHLITARSINTVFGRKIMGLIIIFTSLGAVNALLTYISSLGEKVFSSENQTTRRLNPKTVIFILLILSIAGLLISGMAGEPEFEVFIRGGIYLWLLNYGIVHLAVYIFSKKTENLNPVSSSHKAYINLLAFIFISALYSGLVLTDPETMLILKFKGIIFTGALSAYLLYSGLLIRLFIKR